VPARNPKAWTRNKSPQMSRSVDIVNIVREGGTRSTARFYQSVPLTLVSGSGEYCGDVCFGRGGCRRWRAR
jgi:type II secretory pathway component PulC